KQQLDRLRVRPLVDAEERLASASGKQPGDRLVGADHQLLDEHVRVRLLGVPGTRNPAVIGELELDFRRLDAQRAPREPALAQLRRDPLGALEALYELRLLALASGEDRLRPAVAEPRAAADHRAVEARLAIVER